MKREFVNANVQISPVGRLLIVGSTFSLNIQIFKFNCILVKISLALHLQTLIVKEI